MASNINELHPEQGQASTAQVRANFAAAKAEIETLQATAYGCVGLLPLDFGDTPPFKDMAEYVVTGLPDLTAGGQVEVSLIAKGYYNHTTDDVLADPPKVWAGKIIAGVGFTCFGKMQHGAGYGRYLVNFSVRY